MFWPATTQALWAQAARESSQDNQVVSTPWLRSDGIEAEGTAFILPDHSPPPSLHLLLPHSLLCKSPASCRQASHLFCLWLYSQGPQPSTWHISTFGESKLCPTWGGSLSSPVVRGSYQQWSQFFSWETQRSRRQSHTKKPGTPFVI